MAFPGSQTYVQELPAAGPGKFFQGISKTGSKTLPNYPLLMYY
jgi:hypothetical protein